MLDVDMIQLHGEVIQQQIPLPIEDYS